MTSPVDNANRWAVLGFTVTVLSVAALIADHAPAAALINESPSLAKGLYVRAAGEGPSVGAIVATPQPAIARAYLRRQGMPAQVLLIKRVAAAAGDRVCAQGDRLILPGRIVPVLARDRQGVALPAWSGCRRLGPGELFLLGDTPGSFDSRYFGPVPARAIEGVYREGVTW